MIDQQWRDEWLQAIDECLKQEKYGHFNTCALCVKVSRQCSLCVVTFYLKALGVWDICDCNYLVNDFTNVDKCRAALRKIREWLVKQ